MMRAYQQFREYLETHKLWEVFTYLFFGVLTTIVNIVSFTIAYQNIGLSWPVSNTVSWIMSVLVAFVTNKFWVFHTQASGSLGLLWEFMKFVCVRLLSYVLDMCIMWLIINVIKGNELVAKVITQTVVIVVNYFFSRLFIFTSVRRNHE